MISRDRLDFTVVGPAVNEASRVAAMCRAAERDMLLSAAFAAAAREEDRAGFVSVGRYALRGVARPAGGIWYPHTLIVRNATEAAPILP
jgi:adenylate cyclase